MEEQENVFYECPAVTVTQSRFLAGGKTYAMRNISSIEVGRIKARKRGAKFFIFIGVLFLIA